MFKKVKTVTTICPLCETTREVHYGTNKEILNIKGEEIAVVANVFYCPIGKHLFSNIKDEEIKIQYAYREFRKRRKLLQPEEIKQIRSKFKLSQEAFSSFLGFGKKTIHRYETGAIPDTAHNSFIKFMESSNNFIIQYGQIKDKLTDRLKQKIEKTVHELNNKEQQLILPYLHVQGSNFSTFGFDQTFIASASFNECSSATLNKSFWEFVGAKTYVSLGGTYLASKYKNKEEGELALAA